MKMKYLLSIAVVSAGALFTSCSKNFLDTQLDVYHTPETIVQNYGTLFNYGNAIYTSLPYGFTELDNNLFSPATDESWQTIPGASSVRLFNQGILSPLNVERINNNEYKKLYEGIRAANFFLEYSKGYPHFLALNRDTTNDGRMLDYQIDSLNIARYRGEAHIAKAFYYSELIKRFGGVPIIQTTMDKAQEKYVPKSSYDEVVEHIISEIDTYKDSLEVDWRTSEFRGRDGRFTQIVALAIKSRTLLYAASPLHNTNNSTAKWIRAAEAAKDLIVNPVYNLSLYQGGYRRLFLDNQPIVSDNREVIFAVRMPANSNPEQMNYPISTPGGSSGVVPSHNLVEAYEYTGTANPGNPYENRDPRLTATVVTNGSSWNGKTIDLSPDGDDDMTRPNATKTGYYLKKFLAENLNLRQGGVTQHNWVVFRYAEILLNYAEAMNEAYGPDATPSGYPMSAKAALKMVRDRASVDLPAITTTDVAEFRNAVKHERRIELAFENHRYWDLLRWQDAATVLNQPLRGVRVTKNGNEFSYQPYVVSNRIFNAPAMYYYPFPQNEIINSNNTLIQNPNY